jgi:acetyltransferase-like isoleucine patch superfamily enzyme
MVRVSTGAIESMSDAVPATEGLMTQDIWILTRTDISSRPWARMQLLPGGDISLYRHPNQRRWAIVDGHLTFFSAKGAPSIRFDDGVEKDGFVQFHGTLSLAGQPAATIRLDQFNAAKIPQHDNLTRIHLKEGIEKAGWTVGDHTYGIPRILDAGSANPKIHIGRFTSIGADVTLSMGNHRTDFVSTYPFADLWKQWPHAPDISNHTSRGDIRIGNDVWIGRSVFIMSGVRVGNGAVIGAASVVTKDVPPYAVVVGVPGSVIRYRFSEEIIAELQAIAWWDWPDGKLDRMLKHVLSTDIEAFISAAKGKPDNFERT